MPRPFPPAPRSSTCVATPALPGLIDLHTHITYYWDRGPGTRPRGQRRLPAVTVFLAQENARRTLETGVTTVRDLNAGNDMDLAMRELIASGRDGRPAHLRVRARPVAGSRPATAPAPEAMAALVEERVKAGVDWIKVFGSRGGFEIVDGTQTVTFDEMKAVVDAAHALGKKVAIHSYGATGVRDAVRAGADSVEHGADVDEETLAEMEARGTVWVPTVDHNRYYIDAQAEYGFPATARGRLKRLHRAQPRVGAPRRRRRREDGDGIGRGLSMFGQNTRELGWFVQGGNDAGAGAGHRHDHAGRAAGMVGSARPRRARLSSPTSSRSRAIRTATSRRCSLACAG